MSEKVASLTWVKSYIRLLELHHWFAQHYKKINALELKLPA
uniref:Uncharacterized protein n=1 Tax=Leclercia adecarboxylata TaxID=83655 RepID=A0A5B8KHT1_9ENTR|nr:Hypothetical protein [Leclercia adecarboxylata]